MKSKTLKKYITTLLFGVTTVVVNAQCWETINTVTTNWQSQQSQNTFDWTAEEYDYFYMKKNHNPQTATTPPATLTLPMWQEQQSTNNNLNLAHFQLQAASFKDHKPEDGWELLVKNFGECCSESKAVENPFFAIYNRYTGVIRAFTYIARTPQSLDLNGAIMQLEFNQTIGGRKTAMLQHLQPIALPVKDFNTSNYFRMPNHYKNSSYWLYAEYQTAYDPCGCLLTTNSLITFRAMLMRNSTVDATLEGSIYENIVNVTDPNTGKSEPATSNSLFSFGNIDLVNAAKEGMKGYKNWDGYRKEAAKFLDQQDQKYKDKLASDFFNSADVIYIDGKKMNTLDDVKKLDNGWKKLLGIDVGDPQVKALKGLASALPYVGTAISLFEFFSDGGSKTSDVKTVRSPMSFNANLALKGTISTEADQEVVTFYTPGTKTSAPNSIPIYNNTLGVINVMEMPKLEYVTYAPSVSTAYPSAAKIRQYRLHEDLRYVLNPAANLELVSADACIVVEYDETIIFNTPNLINDVDQMPVEFTNFSSSTDMNNYYNSTNVVDRLENQGWELDYMTDNYFNNFGTIRFRTPYVPLSCLKSQSFALNWRHFSNQTFRNKAPKIFVRVMFRLKRTDDPTADPITKVQSYLIENATANAVAYTTTEYTYDIGYAWISSPTFWQWNNRGFTNSNPIFASNINAPDYITINSGETVARDIYAKKGVIIKSNVTILQGVKIYAGETIVADPNNTFPAGVEFIIGNHIGNCNVDATNMVESNTKITNICNGSDYTNRAGSKTSPIWEAEKSEINHDDWKITIKPNPSMGDFFVELTGSSSPDSEIDIMSLTGQKLWSTRVNNEQVMNKVYYVPDIDLANGVYLVTVTNGNTTNTTKLVITR